MNGLEELARCNSPRLPAEGKEINTFHDSTENLEPSKYSSWTMDHPSKEKRAATPIRHCSSEESFTNNGHLSLNSNVPVENVSNQTSPACYGWATNILCLLHDQQGVSLYNQFLVEEGLSNRCLNFWLACTNLKTAQCIGNIRSTIQALYRTFVRRSKEISHNTKNEIKRKINSEAGPDSFIFDDAKKEIEDHLRRTTYPNFLRSDVYIQYLRSYQDKNIKVESSSLTNNLELHKSLPTVHEDSELQITVNNKLRLSKEPWLRNNAMEVQRSRQEASVGRYMKSHAGNYGSYHLKYASFLPASAQDSELQSLSSDAQTDDTLSQTGSSVDFGPPRSSSSRQRKHQKFTKHSVNLNNRDTFPENNFIPRTKLPVPPVLEPGEFHSTLVKKLNDYLESSLKEKSLKEKIFKRIRSMEGSEEEVKPLDCNQQHNSQGRPPSEPAFVTMLGYVEDNEQDILDRHISRVWHDSAHLTPVLSPGCTSPPVMKTSNEIAEFYAVPCKSSVPEAMSDVGQGSAKCNFATKQNVQFGALQTDSLRHRRDHDTRSYDSGAVSEEAFVSHHRNLPSGPSNQYGNGSIDCQRHHKEQLRHCSRDYGGNDSSSSCVDSGVSVVYNSTPFIVHEKVFQWCNAPNNFFNAPSPDLRRESRKPLFMSESFGASQNMAPTQPIAQDPLMPILPPPNTTTQLLEASRRLDEKFPASVKLAKSKKQNRKSIPSPQDHAVSSNPSISNEMTIIGYCYGNHSVPYLSKFPGKNITLKQFKSHLSKKGNFRYFFKKASNEFETGVVMEEICEDNEILPLWEGKVFSVIESAE